MHPTVQALKSDIAALHASVESKHRSGEDPLQVVALLSDGVDTILKDLFADLVGSDEKGICMLAVGGYGRRELCPRSDIDLLFLRERDSRTESVEKLIRLLWDGGFQVGHSVRTVEECHAFMCDDLSTANAMLESRMLRGSAALHEAFVSRALRRYSRQRGAGFVAAKLELLRNSVEDPTSSIYVVEPKLKDGSCTLRDIQRVLWIENMTHGGGIGFEALLAHGEFPTDAVEKLRAAYAFYLRVRCELHFRNRVRQDILERDSVLPVARELGYGNGAGDQEAVEALMGDYFRHARQVYRFLRFYVERRTEKGGLKERISRRFTAEEVRPHLTLWKGRIYLGEEPGPDQLPVETILDIFAIAQDRDARPSEILCDWIRRRIASIDPQAFQTPEALRIFRSLIQKGRGAGRLLKILHETEMLGRILPEFAALTCRVNYDGHHQFTVDEHTLRTLEELDRIETDASYPEKEFARVMGEIKDLLPLRMALLLHDTGKATPGDHSVTGTEVASLICTRLGFDEKITAMVDFLVYRHLELFRVSELRDFGEEEVIASLARLVESEERLKMLYLLTYIDVVCVGPGTWTHWKGAQLSELFQRTLIHLRTGGPQRDELEALLAPVELPDDRRRAVIEHCALVESQSYARQVLPERMAYHVGLVEKFRETREMQVDCENHLGFYDVTFCGGDRPRLFADLTGLLYSEGFNVLGAKIYSRKDGVVIDIFQVEVADSVQLGAEDRVERIRAKLRKIQAKKQMVEDFIRQRTKTYQKRWRKPLFGPGVSFDNESSPVCTVIEVSAGDRPGLLYDLARAIHHLGLDLRAAKVSTLLDRAHDAFYVVELDGRKVDNPARRSEISQVLKAHAQAPGDSLLRTS